MSKLSHRMTRGNTTLPCSTSTRRKDLYLAACNSYYNNSLTGSPVPVASPKSPSSCGIPTLTSRTSSLQRKGNSPVSLTRMELPLCLYPSEMRDTRAGSPGTGTRPCTGTTLLWRRIRSLKDYGRTLRKRLHNIVKDTTALWRGIAWKDIQTFVACPWLRITLPSRRMFLVAATEFCRRLWTRYGLLVERTARVHGDRECDCRGECQ